MQLYYCIINKTYSKNRLSHDAFLQNCGGNIKVIHREAPLQNITKRKRQSQI